MEAGEEGDETVAHDLERSPDLELLDVLGEIARGHPPVDVFVTGQRAELVDAGLDVVAGDRLALSDRCQVDLVLTAS